MEFEAHILQFRSTHEYFETAEYEVQTPTRNTFLVVCARQKCQIPCLAKRASKEKHAYILNLPSNSGHQKSVHDVEEI